MIRQYKVYVVCGQSVWSHWSANVDAAIIYQWWLLRRKEKEIANEKNRLRYTHIYIYIYILNLYESIVFLFLWNYLLVFSDWH